MWKRKNKGKKTSGKRRREEDNRRVKVPLYSPHAASQYLRRKKRKKSQRGEGGGRCSRVTGLIPHISECRPDSEEMDEGEIQGERKREKSVLTHA